MKCIQAKSLTLSLVFAAAMSSKTYGEYSRRRNTPSHVNQKRKRHVLLKDEEEERIDSSFFAAENGQVTNDIWTSEKEIWDRMLQDMSMSMMMGGDAGFQVDLSAAPNFIPAEGALIDLTFDVTNFDEEDLEFEIEIEPDIFTCFGDVFGPVVQGETFDALCVSDSNLFDETRIEATVTNINNGEEVEVEILLEVF